MRDRGEVTVDVDIGQKLATIFCSGPITHSENQWRAEYPGAVQQKCINQLEL